MKLGESVLTVDSFLFFIKISLRIVKAHEYAHLLLQDE